MEELQKIHDYTQTDRQWGDVANLIDTNFATLSSKLGVIDTLLDQINGEVV